MSGTSSYRQFVSRGRKNSNFMRQFRDSTTKELIKLTSQQFMDVWKHYDHDGKEMIDTNISLSDRYSTIIWSLSRVYLFERVLCYTSSGVSKVHLIISLFQKVSLNFFDPKILLFDYLINFHSDKKGEKLNFSLKRKSDTNFVDE